jgi:hypothetical protein
MVYIYKRIMEGRNALLVGLCCGFINVLCDIDHIIGAWFGIEKLYWRFLHIPVFIFSGISLFCVIAYGAGLYHKNVLNK